MYNSTVTVQLASFVCLNVMVLVAVRGPAAVGTFVLEHMTGRLTAVARLADFCPFVCIRKGHLWESDSLSQMVKGHKNKQDEQKRILVFLWFGQTANAVTLQTNT